VARFEMGVDVSICIATYRRPEGLSRLLDSLERLKLPIGIRIETIVVDNDSDASAASIALSRSGSIEPLHYCVEPCRNIALARNQALSEASGEWILFIDDDEVADENWISEYLKLVEREPCDGAFGPVLPRFEVSGPGWIDIDTCFWDERLSTRAAERMLIDADVSRQRRGQLVDKAAAAYILQGALDFIAKSAAASRSSPRPAAGSDGDKT